VTGVALETAVAATRKYRAISLSALRDDEPLFSARSRTKSKTS